MDRELSDYKTGAEITKEAEWIEIADIEAEHSMWIAFTKWIAKRNFCWCARIATEQS